MALPKDPTLLLSYLNTQLRDFYPSLDDFCDDKDVCREDIEHALEAIDYRYNPASNRFE